MEMTVSEDIINEVSDVDIVLDKEKLRVVVEVDGNEMRILCEGYCDMDKVIKDIYLEYFCEKLI